MAGIKEALISPERLLAAQRAVLRVMARGAPLTEVLERLAAEAEEMFPGLRCTILELDAGRLLDRAGPSMARSYRDAIHGIEIGPMVGCCGAAAFHGTRVVARDVLTHPNWANYSPRQFGERFRACWSEPIKASCGKVLGTFALYHDEPCEPQAFEFDWIEAMAEIAAIAMESERSMRERHDSDERFRQLAENLREVFWLTEWTGDINRVLYISPAYETVYGRTCQSLYDAPRSWTSDIHPEDRAGVIDAFVHGAAEGRFDVEYRILRPDGQLRWIHDRAFPIRDKRNLVYRVAGLSEDITERKLAEIDLARAMAELEARSRARESSLQTEILLAEERERRRLAVDLHDGLNQLLTLSQMKLRALSGNVAAEHASSVEEIMLLVAQADQSARTLSFELCPPILHDFGFEPAVQWLAEHVTDSYGVRVDVLAGEEASPIEPNVRALLYRAVRELLINVAKHAQASRTVVKIRRSKLNIEVTVQDDGVAFDPRAVDGRGLGLSSIRERLESLGGRMRIYSRAGVGTAVKLIAPLSLTTAAAEFEPTENQG